MARAALQLNARPLAGPRRTPHGPELSRRRRPGALPAFATSLAIGLLIGLERERRPGAKAGLRTFALVSLFGTLSAMLSERMALALDPRRGAAHHRAHDHRRLPPGRSAEDRPGHHDRRRRAGRFLSRRRRVVRPRQAGGHARHRERPYCSTSRPSSRDSPSGSRGPISFRFCSSPCSRLVVLPILPDRGYPPFDALNPLPGLADGGADRGREPRRLHRAARFRSARRRAAPRACSAGLYPARPPLRSMHATPATRKT